MAKKSKSASRRGSMCLEEKKTERETEKTGNEPDKGNKSDDKTKKPDK